MLGYRTKCCGCTLSHSRKSILLLSPGFSFVPLLPPSFQNTDWSLQIAAPKIISKHGLLFAQTAASNLFETWIDLSPFSCSSPFISVAAHSFYGCVRILQIPFRTASLYRSFYGKWGSSMAASPSLNILLPFWMHVDMGSAYMVTHLEILPPRVQFGKCPPQSLRLCVFVLGKSKLCVGSFMRLWRFPEVACGC